MAPTIQRISTMVYCWDSRERWRKRSCTFYVRASWAVNSIKRRKGNCDFHSPLDSVTTRMVILSLTPTKKCAAQYPWYFACFEKQAVPLPWYRTSPSVHCVFPSAATAELGTASWYGVVLLTRVCCVCSRTHLMPACMSAVAMPDWRVQLRQHHDGYISWDEFLENGKRLEKNRTNGEATMLSGPAREGLALLQGLLLCGNCGHAITVRYTGNGGIYPTYLCNRQRREGLATKDCMSFRCDLLDAAVSEEVLKVLRPAELQLALAALQELETRDQGILRQWQMRLERAEYEAALAERRYQEVDPSNRLVANTLERRWNETLLHLQDLKKQAADFQRKEARVFTPEQKAKVLALARNFPRLWHAPSTQAKDRKRMLRLLIKDITVNKLVEQRQLSVHIRCHGGACTDLFVQIPPSAAGRHRYRSPIVDRIRDLACSLLDAQIADQLNREGCTSAKGKSYTGKMIRLIRWRYQIPLARLKKSEELTVQQVAKQFGVSDGVVYYWIEHNVIQARRLNPGMPCWITLTAADERELRDWVRNSSRIHSVS